MIKRLLIDFVRNMEDPRHPLLGPILKGLQLFGLWQCGTRFANTCYNLLHLFSFLFVITEFVELWHLRGDFNKTLENLSVSVLSVVSVIKSISFVKWQPIWQELVHGISTWELSEMKKQDESMMKSIKKYTKYARVLTYSYWSLTSATTLVLIVTPLLKLLSPTYRREVFSGEEEFPQILGSWFPFNRNKFPGTIFAYAVHILMVVQGGGCVAVFDVNSIVVMVFLKGQMDFFHIKCRRIFQDKEIDVDKVKAYVKECHDHHNFLLRSYALFNSVLSPVMFLYVLVCSMMICCGVVEISSNDATFSQKMFVIEYTLFLIVQLFFYCWHSNEVILESTKVDRSVYESDWWKGDKRTRTSMLLLAGKLNRPLELKAGPFTTLSVPTFLQIMKGSYSFYALFTKMQE